MIFADITLGGQSWLGWAVGLAVVALIALAWAYRQAKYAVWTRAVAAVLKAAGIDDPVLVGHSDGASISIIHAGSGGKARALMLEAPHVFTEEMGLRSIAKAREAYETSDLRTRLAKYHQNVDAAFWGWNRPWLDPEFRKWNLEEFLPRISVPILVVQGENDEYGTRKQVDAIQRGAQPGPRLDK